VAQQVVVVDDLTGEPGAQTRGLRIDGVEYEIDLTDASFKELQDLLRPYLEAARVVRSRAGTASSGRPVRRAQVLPSSTATIRAWAGANGVACPQRGRIPASVIAAYEQAMGASAIA